MREGFLPHDSFRERAEAAVERIVATDDLDDFLGWFSGEVYRRYLYWIGWTTVSAPMNCMRR